MTEVAAHGLFERDGDGFLPSEFTRGPWRPDAQHGGPPSALLGHLVEPEVGETEFLTHLEIELLRPVPLTRLHGEVRREQVSGRVARLHATLFSETEPVARANALVLQRTELDPPDWVEPGEPGLLSVTVTRARRNAARFPTAQDIEEAVRAGASPLAPEGVEVLKTESSTGLFMMQARDNITKSNSFAPTHWRSVFAANGFAVATRLNVFKEQPISTSGGFSTLKSLADQIKADNGVSESETVAAVSKPKTNTGAAKSPGLFGNIFRRN